MNEELKGYLDALIPSNLPKKKREKLYDELSCHLLDRTEEYEKLGYSEEESVKRAIEDAGTDENINRSIASEFESLYHERTRWAVIAAAAVLLMDVFCLLFGVWVTSADWNAKATPGKALASFLTLFVCVGLVFFARAKRYRKMLWGLATAFLAVSFPLWCFLPQAAFYAMENDAYLLIDRFTPFVLPINTPVYLFADASVAFTVLCAVYCAVAAIRIGTGKARPVNNPRKKAVVLGACFAVVTAGVCGLLPRALTFSREYPDWFDDRLYAFQQSDAQNDAAELFDAIELNAPYADAAALLTASGRAEINEYGNSLDKNARKKFFAQYDELSLGDEYTVWFRPDRLIYGNGFVFLKTDAAGNVVGKGVGSPDPFARGRYGFRFDDPGRDDDMQKLTEDFENLKKGEPETAVMRRFGREYGCVYSRFESVADGKHVDRFAVYAWKGTYPDAGKYDQKYHECRIELTFTDGVLSDGRMLLSCRADGSPDLREITIADA